MRTLLWVSLALATLTLMACASDGDDPEPAATAKPIDPAAYADPGPHAVGVTTLDLVDTSRPTPPNGAFAGSPQRRLVTEVWYPASASPGTEESVDAALEAGPYPLIVFAHGFTAFRRQSASYARHLASHGYIVASPDFPTTGLTSEGGPQLVGVLEQPGDVGFIIDEMTRFNTEPGNRFEDAFDGRVGITGHSLGGLTSLLTIYGPLRDERVIAAVPFSAPACFLEDRVVGDADVPVMHVGGSEDLIVDPQSIRHGYDVSNAPRYFIELRGADHVGFADIDVGDEVLVDNLRAGTLSEDSISDDARAIIERIGSTGMSCISRAGAKGHEKMAKNRQRELMRLFGALFFDAHLKGDDAALNLLRGGSLASPIPETGIEFE